MTCLFIYYGIICMPIIVFSVATMKRFETRKAAIYNTPVKISSPGDIGLSQPEPMFEVGWDCHSPCDEGN